MLPVGYGIIRAVTVQPLCRKTNLTVQLHDVLKNQSHYSRSQLLSKVRDLRAQGADPDLKIGSYSAYDWAPHDQEIQEYFNNRCSND